MAEQDEESNPGVIKPDLRDPNVIKQFIAMLHELERRGVITADQKEAMIAAVKEMVLSAVRELAGRDPSPELARLILDLLDAAGLSCGEFAEFLARCLASLIQDLRDAAGLSSEKFAELLDRCVAQPGATPARPPASKMG